MTVYEYLQKASKEEVRDFLSQFYNKAWFDGTRNEDDENWVYYYLTDLDMNEWEKVE